MGTERPSVTVRAATLAGGSTNQDRYACGDGWAFVLDGASSFDTRQPEHDGGWYAERLKNSLAEAMSRSPEDDTASIVGQAIARAAIGHEDPETCPTSTIALARWDSKRVEAYVLGDSTAALVTTNNDLELTDTRMSAVGADLRNQYRARLSAGYGFDAQHRKILRQLQARQKTARNVSGGYWIAGADPRAATMGLSSTHHIEKVSAVVLATDGAAAGISRYHLCESWRVLARQASEPLLRDIHRLEAQDKAGQRFPRSKRHDDASILVVRPTVRS